MTALAGSSQAYLDQFGALRDGLPGAGLPWLSQLREAGADGFADRGFPTPKVEDWKYTNLNPLHAVDFVAAPLRSRPLAKDTLPSLVMGKEPAYRLVFLNGIYQPRQSTMNALPAGVSLLSLAEALADRADLLEGRLGSVAPGLDGLPLMALNTAFIRDGYVLHLADGVTLDEPVEIVSVGSGPDRPVAYHPRNLIVAEAGSYATVIEYHIGRAGRRGAYFSNGATEILAERGAVVRHCRVQDDGRDAFNIGTTQVRLGRDALFDSFSFSLGGRLQRNEVHVHLGAPGANCRLNGAYLMKDRQHVDNTTVVIHASPETSSRQLFKGVLDDRARGVFQGRITVEPDAQKADGHQMSRTLLLSDRAETDTKPELEIFADDVKCSHGATAGDIDEESLFYLRSRGIPERRARRILVEAFLGEVIDGIALAGLRVPLEEDVASWMES